MLLQSLRALWNPPGGAGSIWTYLEALVRATGVSGQVGYGFRTKLHIADGLEEYLEAVSLEAVVHEGGPTGAETLFIC